MLGKLLTPTPRQEPQRPTRCTAHASTHPLPPLVAIGASTGGPAALACILSGLPAGFPAALVIIQHVDVQFAAGLADWLQARTTLPVCLAQEGSRPEVGAVWLAGTRRAGWYTIAQDQASSVIYGMPKAAAEVGAAMQIVSLEAMASTLVQFFGESRL
jgi:chemotaxis response regulator CheB